MPCSRAFCGSLPASKHPSYSPNVLLSLQTSRLWLYTSPNARLQMIEDFAQTFLTDICGVWKQPDLHFHLQQSSIRLPLAT
jgi:hypothetical protein